MRDLDHSSLPLDPAHRPANRIAQKVDGGYADETMGFVITSETSGSHGTLEGGEDAANTLLEGTCTTTSVGTSITPSDSACLKLTFDSDSFESVWSIDVTRSVAKHKTSIAGRARERTQVRQWGGGCALSAGRPSIVQTKWRPRPSARHWTKARHLTGLTTHHAPPFAHSVDYVAIWAEHVPTEFEDTTHYLRSTDGDDVEPLHELPEADEVEKVGSGEEPE